MQVSVVHCVSYLQLEDEGGEGNAPLGRRAELVRSCGELVGDHQEFQTRLEVASGRSGRLGDACCTTYGGVFKASLKHR